MGFTKHCKVKLIRAINTRKYSTNPHLKHLSNLKCNWVLKWLFATPVSAEMKGRHTCQAQSHVGQTKCISLMYNTSWLFHLPHSWAVSGNREESLFEHAPQSIPTILGSILICYNQWKHWIHTLCLQELFSTNVWTLQITSINKIQTSIEDMLPPPLPSMQKMLVTSHLGYYRLCCIPSIWLALNRIISRHKYIQTIENSHQLYSAMTSLLLKLLLMSNRLYGICFHHCTIQLQIVLLLVLILWLCFRKI